MGMQINITMQETMQEMFIFSSNIYFLTEHVLDTFVMLIPQTEMIIPTLVKTSFVQKFSFVTTEV